MKILARDRESASARLRVDNLDDLWHLREIVEPGDVVTALTLRTAESDKREHDRAGKAEKRPVVLAVRVERVEFAEFSNRLRLLGPIVEGPFDVGSYHTIVVEPGSEVTLRKARGYRRHHEERLEEAVAATQRPVVAFLAMEENEAVVALLRQYGVQRMAEVFGHASGKQYASSRRDEEDFFQEVAMALRDYRPEDAPLLVVGPGFAKERFLAYAREKAPDAVKGAQVESTGQAGMTGIHEALRRGTVARVAKENRVAKETAFIEALLEAIAANRPATYGPQETRRALEVGAVDVLLVADRLIREGPGEELLDLARRMGSEAHVVSTLHEAGRRFDAMGGVGALLRYALPEGGP